MARFLMSGDEAARAVREAEDAFARLSKPDDSRQQLRNWLTLVRAQIASRQTDAASASVERMLIQAARDANPAARLYARLAQAETMAATGNAQAANETFEARVMRRRCCNCACTTRPGFFPPGAPRSHARAAWPASARFRFPCRIIRPIPRDSGG
jgi:hypothetical protein